MFPTDLWQTKVASNLGVLDLCRLTQVNKEFMSIFLADRAWYHQHNRVCSKFPALVELFVRHRPKDAKKRGSKRVIVHSSGTKKRKLSAKDDSGTKTATETGRLIIPRCGIWYVFKRWLSKGFDIVGFRTLLRDESMHILMDAILRNQVPLPENWARAWVVTRRNAKKWFVVEMRNKINVDRHIDFHIAPVSALIKAHEFDAVNRPDTVALMREWGMFRDMQYDYLGPITPASLPRMIFRTWRNFLLQGPWRCENWTPALEMFAKNE